MLNKRLYRSILLLAACSVFSAAAIGIINHRVKQEGSTYIVSEEEAPSADAILVLGALVKPGGIPSDMLHDRLQVALNLYQRNVSDKILVSGDHGSKQYDEVGAMKAFLENRDVKPEDIFMDHAGFSTYESLYRARDIFKVRKVVIVTQEYHLMRAIYAARQMGLEAYGISADLQTYSGMPRFEMREIAARSKDFLFVHVLNPKPTYLGDTIPITGDGRLTRDP